MFKTILVPTDGSAVAALAIGPAIELARQQQARIVGLAVAETAPALAGSAIDAGDQRMIEAEMLASAQGYVNALLAAARAADVPCSGIVVLAARPHEAIVRTASEQRCDLIVMATNGRRGMQRVMVGSQTEKVLLSATVPVLLYRPQQAD